MTRKLVFLLLAALAVAALTVGVAAPAIDDSDTQLSGGTLERASQAALAHTGGGKVVDSETGDDGAAYGVEVQLADGGQVEVSLDGDFNVVGQEADDDSDEGASGDGSSSDD